MKVVVTAQSEGLDAMSSPVFGRCPCFVFVDTDTMSAQSAQNPAAAAGGGAGIQAAQYVVSQGAKALLTHNVGPNAMGVLQPAGVEVYRIEGGTVREAVQALLDKRLAAAAGPNVEAHSGMRGRPRG